MAKLINVAEGSGTFNSATINDFSTVTVYTSAILVEKTASPILWMTGDLEYRISVSNMDTVIPPSPILNPKLTDTIDPEIATLKAGSVYNGIDPLTPALDPENPTVGEYVYNEETGELSIPLATLDENNLEMEIIFLVEQKT